MRLLPRLLTSSEASLRITARGDTPVPFTALVLHERVLRRPAVEVIRGVTPFEQRLPDGDVTIVVRTAPDGPVLAAEYSREAGGEVILQGRTMFETPVLHVRGGRITCAGLDGAHEGGREVA